jgi:hypothetical protein
VQWENGYGMQAGEHAGGARSWTMKLVDSGRVPNGAPQFVGRPEGELQWQADVGRGGRVDRRDVLPARFCGRSRADLLLERQSATLLPSCPRPNYQSNKHPNVKSHLWTSLCRHGPLIEFTTIVWLASLIHHPANKSPSPD